MRFFRNVHNLNIPFIFSHTQHTSDRGVWVEVNTSNSSTNETQTLSTEGFAIDGFLYSL